MTPAEADALFRRGMRMRRTRWEVDYDRGMPCCHSPRPYTATSIHWRVFVIECVDCGASWLSEIGGVHEPGL